MSFRFSKFIKLWLPVLLWAGLIFFLSNQPDIKSGLPAPWDFILGKSAHIGEYFILTLFLIRAFARYSLTKRKIFFLAVFFAFSYALSDEYHQSFIAARTASLKDVAIDGLGIFLTWLWRF